MNMQQRSHLWVAAILLCRLVTGARGETLSIENTSIRIDVDSQSGATTMRDRAANLYFVGAIQWPGNRTLREVRRADRESTTWGRGQSIVLQWTDHSQAIVTLYQGLPFAVIQDVIVNGDAEDIQIGRASCRKECRSGWSP